MKILLDENLPHAFRHLIPGHDVFTVSFLGWSGTKNGALLKRADENQFEVFITLDQGVAYQQNLSSLKLSVLILAAPSSDIDDLSPLVPAILKQLAEITGSSAYRISN